MRICVQVCILIHTCMNTYYYRGEKMQNQMILAENLWKGKLSKEKEKFDQVTKICFVYSQIDIHKFSQISIHTYIIHSYMHTYILAYIHTVHKHQIHTYIHTYNA